MVLRGRGRGEGRRSRVRFGLRWRDYGRWWSLGAFGLLLAFCGARREWRRREDGRAGGGSEDEDVLLVL